MELPFTAEQFFAIFSQYNQVVWPAQVGLNLLALAAVYLLLRPRPLSGRLISIVLAFLWAWTGIVYHLAFFAAINKAAYAFGALFLAGSVAFLLSGVFKQRFEFVAVGPRRAVGHVLLAFALVVYPFLSALLGHGYPAMPTFGLPCPTTIFTIGVLCFLRAPFPRFVFGVPVLWAAIGSQAAFLLGVYQDLGLLAAGIVGAVIMLKPQAQAKAR